MRLNLGRKGLLAALATSTLLVAGCATPTTYRPATGSGFSRQGFSELAVTPDRVVIAPDGLILTNAHVVQCAKDVTVKPVGDATISAFTVSPSAFIAACALVRPTGIEGLTPKSVKKKLKQPSFAAGVNRQDVYEGAEELGVDQPFVSRARSGGLKRLSPRRR